MHVFLFFFGKAKHTTGTDGRGNRSIVAPTLGSRASDTVDYFLFVFSIPVKFQANCLIQRSLSVSEFRILNFE